MLTYLPDRSSKLKEAGKISRLSLNIVRTFAMIKPDAYTSIGKIVDIIERSGFVISNMKMAKFTLSDAEEFYGEHKVNGCEFSNSSGKAILRRTYQVHLQ
jgi:nucleoside diphosphate kinase